MRVGDLLLFALVLVASFMYESTRAQLTIPPSSHRKLKYYVQVTTGNGPYADTEANVYLVIYGSKGNTGEIHLKDAVNTTDLFEMGQTDYFVLDVEDVGEIKKIKVRQDNTNEKPFWFPEDVRISTTPNEEPSVFRLHRWVNNIPVESQVELKTEPTNTKEFKYYVQVTTGNEEYADTESNVYLVIYGSKGDTGEIHLTNAVNTTDLFENGQTDYFVLYAEDIGEMEKVRVRQDNTEEMPSWFLEDVRISTTRNQEPSVFRFHIWVMSSWEESQIELKTELTNSQVTTESPKLSTISSYCSLHTPCQNGGSCTDGAKGTDYQCKCLMGYDGKDCQYLVEKKRTFRRIPFHVEAMQPEEIKEIVLTDDRCERKVSVGIPQVKYMATLSCEEGTILIKSVAYGSGTHWHALIDQIGKICDHQTQCNVAAKDDMLDDPFRRVYKRLIIVYECGNH